MLLNKEDELAPPLVLMIVVKSRISPVLLLPCAPIVGRSDLRVGHYADIIGMSNEMVVLQAL